MTPDVNRGRDEQTEAVEDVIQEANAKRAAMLAGAQTAANAAEQARGSEERESYAGGKNMRLVNNKTGIVAAIHYGVLDGTKPRRGFHFDQASQAGVGEKA